MSRTVSSYQYLQILLHDVRLLHQFFDVSFDALDSFRVTCVLRGLKRVLGTGQHKKLPITPAILTKLYQFMDFSIPAHATLWAMFLIAFFTFLRKSNLTLKSVACFNPDTDLTRADIIVRDNFLILQIKKSKTVQFNEHVHLLPVVCIPNSVLCPVSAYHHMLDLVPATSSSPAFVYPTKKGLMPVTHSFFVTSLRKFLGLAGLQPDLYSGHSFRRGGCTFAFQSGVSSDLIKLHGHWSSDAYQQYLQLPLSTLFQTTMSMRNNLV